MNIKPIINALTVVRWLLGSMIASVVFSAVAIFIAALLLLPVAGVILLILAIYKLTCL